MTNSCSEMYNSISCVIIAFFKGIMTITKYLLTKESSVVFACDRTSTISYRMLFKAVLKF